MLFFVLPNIQMFLMSLSTRAGGTGLTRQYEFTWAWQNYVKALTDFPEQFGNSLVYGGLATLLCFLIGYPLAYGIAFRGGRYKNVLLFLVIAPFFTSFLIRTISWKIILGNDGAFLVDHPRRAWASCPPNFSILGTPLAVVSGLTYQFLPFMVLPLYVSLEKIDRRLIEAARDLYAGPWRRGGAIVGGVVRRCCWRVVLDGRPRLRWPARRGPARRRSLLGARRRRDHRARSSRRCSSPSRSSGSSSRSACRASSPARS